METDRASIRILRQGPALLSSVSTGFMPLEIAELLIRIGDEEADRAGRGLVHFLDWRAVTGYDGEGRKRCTAWALRRHPSPELHILSSHRLVRMGLSAASMMLAVAGKRILRAYERADDFDAALADRVRAPLPKRMP